MPCSAVPPPARFYLARTQRLEAAKRKQERATNSNADNHNVDNDNNDDDDEDGGDDSELDEDELEARNAAEYFEDGDAPATGEAAGAAGADGGNSAGGGGGGGVPFQQLNISRPLLRAVEAMGYVTPTPVQQRAVPFALAGRCVVS